MYEVFYKLQAEPFRLSPDHRFCYEHNGYARARAEMDIAYKRGEGLVMITGPPGTGKTTLVSELFATLAAENVVKANLVSTQLRADELLKMVAYSFGLDSRLVDSGELPKYLGELLLKWRREGRRALLIVDEAQGLSTSALDELGWLSDIQADGKSLLQIFLLGQSEFRNVMQSPELEQVQQRLIADIRLEALEEEETRAYIAYRLKKAGWQGNPALSKAVFPLIYKFTQGVPRRINLICSRLLLHGAIEQLDRIGVGEVRQVIHELQSETLAVNKSLSNFDFAVEDVFEDSAEPGSLDLDEPGNRPPESNAPMTTTVPNRLDERDLPKGVAGQHTATGSSPRRYWGAAVMVVFAMGVIALLYTSFEITRDAPGRWTVVSKSWWLDDPESRPSALPSQVTPATVQPAPGPPTSAETPLVETPAVDSVPPALSIEALSVETPSVRSDAELAVLNRTEAVEEPRSGQVDSAEPERPVEPENSSSENGPAPASLDQPAVPGQDPDRDPVFERKVLIPFPLDSAEVPAYSYSTLDRIVRTMVESPDSTALIAGRPDYSAGTEIRIEFLQQRAVAVARYLVERGIDAQRLEARGAIAPNPINTDTVSASSAEAVVQIIIRGADQ